MKTEIYENKIINTFILVCLFSQVICAQFTSPGNGIFTTTTLGANATRKIGIGNITPLSVFHIDGDAIPIGSRTGEVFRTNAPLLEDSYWRMWRNNTKEIAMIYNLRTDNHLRIRAAQQNSDIVFHTDFSNPTPFVYPTAERMRISSLNAPLGGWAFPINVTRVSICETPFDPITIPRSLLHLGFNSMGWGLRTWMDVGVFLGVGTDNMYIGMKDDSSPQGGIWGAAEQSAVISWGDNLVLDKLRFVFTAESGNGLAGNVAGLEIARMETTSNGNSGRMGIGNFFTIPSIPLNNTLEIRSNTQEGDTRSGLRLTNLTSAMPVDIAITNNKVLSVNGTGDVILVEGGKGISECNSPTILTANSGILHNGSSFYFDATNNNERVGVGVACGNNLPAKFNVRGNAVIGRNYINNNTASPANGLLVQGFTGVGLGFSNANQPARQLDVINGNAPQLRLTRSLISSPGSPASFTDFETTPLGNLRINPSDGPGGLNPRVGINVTAPLEPENTLEIFSGIGAPTRSGLRLTNLNTLIIDAPANTNNTVLSVNDDGDVILVEDRSGIQGCINPLVGGDAGIQLSGFNFYFDGQTPGKERVGIGMSCGTSLFAKFNVNQELLNPSTFQASGAFNVYGTNNKNVISIAVHGISQATGLGFNVGGNFMAVSTNNTNYGVRTWAKDAKQNYGGYFETGPNGNPTFPNPDNIAVYGRVNSTGLQDYAGYFVGNVHATGSITNGSDKNLKENITPLDNALSLLSNVKPSKFNFKTMPYMALPSGLQYGVIAQDLQSVFPDLVSDVIFPEIIDTAGNVVNPTQTFKGVNYIGLIPIAIQGIKELDLKILKATLSDTQLKQNVQPLQNSLSLISQLNGVTFDWNQLVDTTLELPSGTEIGLIAQAVEAVLPEVIYTDNKGYKHVEYQKIVPVLIEANKELQDSLTTLKNQLATLAQQVAAIQTCMDNLPIGAGCNGASARTANPTNNNSINNAASVTEIQKISLSSTDIAVLYQNQPNPFNNTTTIRYYLPSDINEAVMMFHDEFGREIGNEILTAKGYGQIEIDSEKLAAGIYTYSIVIDGKVFETKKMIKVRP